MKRPAWFFDIAQQGEGNADVATHLVDLIQWSTFAEVTLAKTDVQMVSAKRWTTDLSSEQFEKVTGMKEFPEFLKKDVADGKPESVCQWRNAIQTERQSWQKW